MRAVVSGDLTVDTGTGASALASIAVEGFSPRRLSEAGREEIAERVDAVLGYMHCPPEPLWPA